MSATPPETSQESRLVQDLSIGVAPLPPELFEIFDGEQLARVEELAQRASGLAEFSFLPDPFVEHAGLSEGLVDPETEEALKKVESLYDAYAVDMASTEASAVARQYSPALKKSALLHREFLIQNHVVRMSEFYQVSGEAAGINPDDDEQVASELPRLHDSLESIAQGLASHSILEDFNRIVVGEARASDADGRSVVLQQEPHLHAQIIRSWEACTSALTEESAKLRVAQFTSMLVELGDRGRNIGEVRRSHRSVDAIRVDQSLANDIVFGNANLRAGGSELHKTLTTMAAASSIDQSRELFDSLVVMMDGLNQRFLSEKARHQLARGGQELSSALAAEAYIAGKAVLVESVMRRMGVKITKEMRRTLHGLKEQELGLTQKRLAKTAIQPSVDPYESTEPDSNFRQECRVARDIIAGGVRLKDPKASKLANRLHILRFGKHDDVALDPDASGVVVAIITGHIESLLSVVDRFERARDVGDVQVEKLRHNLPEQFAALKNFNLDSALAKLRAMLENGHDNQRLYTAVQTSITTSQLKSAIDSLIRLRSPEDPENARITPQSPSEEGGAAEV